MLLRGAHYTMIEVCIISCIAITLRARCISHAASHTLHLVHRSFGLVLPSCNSSRLNFDRIPTCATLQVRIRKKNIPYCFCNSAITSLIGLSVLRRQIDRFSNIVCRFSGTVKKHCYGQSLHTISVFAPRCPCCSMKSSAADFV